MKTSELDGVLRVSIDFPSLEPYCSKYIFSLMSLINYTNKKLVNKS